MSGVEEGAINKLLQKAMDIRDQEPSPNTDDTNHLTAKKSRYMSIQARDMGNIYFENNDFTLALYYYTHSISFAQDQSLELALAFGNRSAVLFEKRYFKECLEDIERAFEANYPDEKKPKLLDRKNRAMKKLKQQKFKLFHDPLPVISNPSDENACVSNCLQKQKNPEFGRFIVANRNIEPGEILVVEDPYCQHLEGDNSWQYCSQCLELCYNPIPCSGCSLATYCSKRCREKAYSGYHKYECLLIQTNEDSFLTCSLFIKITLKCLLEKREGDTETFSKQYQQIQKLLTHKSKISRADLEAIEERVDKVYDLLTTKTDFLDQIDLKDKKGLLKYTLLHNCLVSKINTINVTTYEAAGSVRFGSAIYAYFSLFNHACSYNVGYSFYGKKIVLRAWRNINKGEQCFVNYGSNICRE